MMYSPSLGLLRLVVLSALLAPMVSSQEKPAAQKPMRLPKAVVLPAGDREIDIDGSLIDWPRLPALQLNDRRQLSGTAQSAWRGRQDASAVVFLMWSDEGLYIACSALDEWHRALDQKTLMLTEIPAADSLVLSFDPDRNTRSNGPDPGRREDREFWIADCEDRRVVQWDRLRGSARILSDPARMVVLHDKENGLTTYEALIPWSEILPPGRHAQRGQCIDLQIVLNDFDESTDSMPQTRIGWTFGMGPVVDPGLLGTIMLVADDAALSGVMPEFPAKPGAEKPSAEPAEYWRELSARLIQAPPVVYDGSLTPPETGGLKRLKALEEIDEHSARFPRVDHLELHQRMHRRMRREIAGLMGRGLPSWWRERMHSVSKQGEDAIPKGGMRLFRLPMGGWLVRTSAQNFVIDPAGNNVAEWLWGGAQFCILTQPLEMTRRSDQLLLRMFTAKPQRHVFAHIVFHMPVIAMNDMPLVKLGKLYGHPSVTTLLPLGKELPNGTVPFDCSYLVETKDCPSLLMMGPTLKAEDVEKKPVDVLIASSRNREAVLIAQKVTPLVVLFDDAMLADTDAVVRRVTLRDLHQLQRSFLPFRSVILAPGESWTVQKTAAATIKKEDK
jgi:hypothetical protein